MSLSVRSLAGSTSDYQAAVGVLAAAVVDLAVALERAVKEFAQRLDEQHQVLDGVPSIHEHTGEGKLLVGHGAREHVSHMIKFGLVI
jgi:hypothetical protein